MRVPLRAINGFSQLLDKKYANFLDKEGKRLLKVISDTSVKMSQLLDDLLSLSRVGRQSLDYSTIDMKSMVEEIFEELKSRPDMSKVTLKLSNIPNARGDSTLIHQVCFNLISNMVKFSSKRKKPVITIGVTSNKKNIEYYVKDNGAGFNSKYIDKLFGIFQRLHNQYIFQGHGIGLSIAHRIITKHGGEIWAESELNKGATFYFTLPSEA